MKLFNETIIDALLHEIGYIKSILDIPEMKIDIFTDKIIQELTETYDATLKESQDNFKNE
jgi:hypothetical protein